ALWDTCGDVVGVNYNFADGTMISIQTDQLIDGLKANGITPMTATQACSSAGGGGKEKTKVKPGEEEGDREAGNRWRLPKGNEWIPVIIIAVVVIFALRPAGKTVARALTTRRRAPIPEPAAYSYPAPAAMPPVFVGTRPVLRGIAGQYAGSS